MLLAASNRVVPDLRRASRLYSAVVPGAPGGGCTRRSIGAACLRPRMAAGTTEPNRTERSELARRTRKMTTRSPRFQIPSATTEQIESAWTFGRGDCESSQVFQNLLRPVLTSVVTASRMSGRASVLQIGAPMWGRASVLQIGAPMWGRASALQVGAPMWDRASALQIGARSRPEGLPHMPHR
jgi:hypothetical protein